MRQVGLGKIKCGVPTFSLTSNPSLQGESKLKSAKPATFKCTGPRKGKVWRVHMFHGKAVRSCDGSTKQAFATNVAKAVLWPTYADKGTLSCEIRVAKRRGCKQERDCHSAHPHLLQHQNVADMWIQLAVKNSQLVTFEAAQSSSSTQAYQQKRSNILPRE